MKIDKLVFVGSGHRGKLCNQIAQMAEIKVECFFDNNDEMVGKSINNVQVKKPQNIVNAIFVLTVYGYEKELREQLLGLGIHNENIISVNQFVSWVVEHIDIKEKSSDMKCNITDYPDTIQFPITYKCNFNCVMCGVHDQEPMIDAHPEHIGKVLKDEYFSHVKNIGINGGEPFIRTDLVECIEHILESLSSLEQISFISNGFFSDKIVKDLRAIKLKCDERGVKLYLSISVDGYGDMQDFHRGYVNAFNNAQETIELIKKEGCVDYLNIITTITRYNIERINELMVWAEEKNIDVAYNIASENTRITNKKRMDDCSVMLDEHTKMLAQEFFYTKYKQYNSERYFSLFKFLQINERVADCPCIHNEWITILPDCSLSLCSPHGSVIGRLDGSNARQIVMDNIEQLKALRKRICNSCPQYMYAVDSYGFALQIQDEINDTDMSVEWDIE